MEEFQGQNTSDTNIDYDLIDGAIKTFKKSAGESIFSPCNNLMKNSKLKFCDLVLIDNESNFLDLKIKMEINPNKNNKSQFSLQENVIKFTNFFETSNNILSSLDYDLSIYTISYFGDKLEKIHSEIDVNNYQGQTIYLKICERYNKRNNVSNSKANLISSHIRNNSHINNSNNKNEIHFSAHINRNFNLNYNNNNNNNNNNHEFSPTNSSEHRLNYLVGRDLHSPSVSRTNLNFYNHKSEKKDKNLTNLIEANLNLNLALKIRRSQSISLNNNKHINKLKIPRNTNINSNNHSNNRILNEDLIKYNGIERSMLLKKEPLYFLKKLKFNRSSNTNKEKAYFDPLHNLIENKDALENKNNSSYNNNYFQYKNKFKKAKLLKNEVLFKNRKLITDQINLYRSLENNNNSYISPVQLKENKNKANNSVIFSNIKKKKILILKENKNEKEKEKEKLNKSNKINIDKLHTFEKISSNNLTNFSVEKNNTKRSFVESFLAKNLDNNTNVDTNPICNSDRNPASLIGRCKKSFTVVKQSKNKNKNKEKDNFIEKDEDSTPYMLTNLSYSDKIKPKIQVSKNNSNIKLNNPENKGSLSSENFYSKAISWKAMTEKKPLGSKLNKANLNENHYYKNEKRFSLSASKFDLLEEEFSDKKNNLTRNAPLNKFSNSVITNSTITEVIKKVNNNSGNLNFKKKIEIKSNNAANNNNHLNSYFTSLNKNNSNSNKKTSKTQGKIMSEVNSNKTSTNFKNSILINKNLNSPNSNYVLDRFVSNDANKNNISSGMYNNNIMNNNLFSLEKNFVFNQTFSNNKDSNINNLKLASSCKIHKNWRKTGTMNSTNFESLIPSINLNQSEKNILNNKNLKDFNEKFDNDKNQPSYKQNRFNNLLKIQEPLADLDRTFSEYLENENIENNETDNMQNFIVINNNDNNNKSNNNFLCNNINSENTRLFNKPTLNNKLFTTNLNNYSENDNNYKTSFFKDNSLSKRRQRENAADTISKNNNKSINKYQNNINNNDLNNKIINNSSSIRSKYRPNIDKKTSDEVKVTRNLIKSFIANNLSIVITDKFIEENLKWLILNDFYKPKSPDLKTIRSEKHNNSNNIVEEFYTSKLNFLSDLKHKSSVIENYNENLISVETNPAQEKLVISPKEYQLAREFIFHNYLNCKSLEKFYFKKLNKNELAPADSTNAHKAMSISLNFLNNQSALGNKNLNYTNLSSTGANEETWFNSANHNLALEFFNTANNSKQVSEYNFLVEEILKKLKKDISGLLSFLNFISLNKMNLQIKNFALDLIFFNLYIVEAKNKAIEEKIIYMLIEFISNEKEKKLFFENYKKFNLLSDKQEFEKTNRNFYSSKFLFFKNFIKMVLKNSQDNIDMIKKSFEISDQEVYFILFSDFSELNEYIQDEDFKSKITGIFDLLIESLK